MGTSYAFHTRNNTSILLPIYNLVRYRGIDMYIGGQHMYLFSRTILIAILAKLYNMVYWAATLSLMCSAPNREAVGIIFNVFSMMRPGREPDTSSTEYGDAVTETYP